MRNTRPADLKKMIQGLIILTLLCWATQTLVEQWGFGEEVFISRRASLVIDAKQRRLHAYWSQPIEEAGVTVARIFHSVGKLK